MLWLWSMIHVLWYNRGHNWSFRNFQKCQSKVHAYYPRPPLFWFLRAKTMNTACARTEDTRVLRESSPQCGQVEIRSTLETDCVRTVSLRGGCGRWWSRSPPQQDPLTRPPTKARGPRYWHMPLSPWILQRKKIRSASHNPFPGENRLSKSWYYWCWWKLRGVRNLFHKSRTVFVGASWVFLLPCEHSQGLGGPLVSSTNVWSAMRLLQGGSDDPRGFGSLVLSWVFLLKFFVSSRIHYKRHNYISFSSLTEHISSKWWFTPWVQEEAERMPWAPAAWPLHPELHFLSMPLTQLVTVPLQPGSGLGHW